MVKIIHTSDIHIKKQGDERWNALLTIIQKAEEESADYLVISGDLFHKDTNADSCLQDLRKHFKGKEFNTYIIPGNHDAESYSKGTYIADSVNILTKKPFEIGEEKEVRFIGLPYHDASSQEILDIIKEADTKLDSKKTNIFLFHGDLADVYHTSSDMGEDEGNKRYMPVRLAYFTSTKADYVLAGHYHKKFIPKKFGDKKYFVYPGSPVSTTKKELETRKVNIFNLGESPEEVEVETFHYQQVSVFLNSENPNPIKTIKKRLKETSNSGEILLSVDGLIQIEEKDFNKKLRNICKKFEIQSENISNRTRNLDHITNTEIYKSFQAKIAEKDADSNLKEDAEKYFLQAAVKELRE